MDTNYFPIRFFETDRKEMKIVNFAFWGTVVLSFYFQAFLPFLNEHGGNVLVMLFAPLLTNNFFIAFLSIVYLAFTALLYNAVRIKIKATQFVGTMGMYGGYWCYRNKLFDKSYYAHLYGYLTFCLQPHIVLPHYRDHRIQAFYKYCLAGIICFPYIQGQGVAAGSRYCLYRQLHSRNTSGRNRFVLQSYSSAGCAIY